MYSLRLISRKERLYLCVAYVTKVPSYKMGRCACEVYAILKATFNKMLVYWP